MEQKQVRSQFSHETMEELRKRVLDLEEQNRVLDSFIEMIIQILTMRKKF